MNAKLSQTMDYHDLLDMQPSLEPRLADAAATAKARALLDALAEVASEDLEEPRRDLADNVSQPAPRLHMAPPW